MNRKAAGNAITVPVGKRVEVVRDGMPNVKTVFLMRYNYRRGTQSIMFRETAGVVPRLSTWSDGFETRTELHLKTH